VSLVTVGEQRDFMRETSTAEDDELQALLDQVEALLLNEANRVDVPFMLATAEDRVEYHDGTGGRVLFLNYPIADVSSIKLGLDPSDPDDTLDPTDKRVVRWETGKRRLLRVDGGVFGKRGTPLYVEVTYDAAADRAQDLDAARLGITRRVAAIWRQRGAEGWASIGQLDVRGQADKELDRTPEWQKAVTTLRRMSVF
jgi:hypothetical protein